MMTRILLLAVALVTGALTPALAGSTVNPNLPAQGSPLSSAPIRGNFAAAYNDVTNILGEYPGTSPPTNPTVGQFWRNTGDTPQQISVWDGTQWVLTAYLNVTTHVYSPNLGIPAVPLTLSLNATTAPTYQTGAVLQLVQADGVTTRAELDSFGAVPRYTCVRWDGTNASPTTIQSADELCSVNSFGYDGTAVVGPQAAFRTYANQNWTHGSALGTYATIAVTPNNSTTLTDVAKFTGSAITLFEPTTLGVQQTTQGQLVLANTAAGAYSTTMQSSNSASATWTMTLPTTAGTSGYVLSTNGSGVTSWVINGSGLVNNSSAITGGSAGYVLYDNGGTLEEYAITGTAGSVVMSGSPTITTPTLNFATGAQSDIYGTSANNNNINGLGAQNTGTTSSTSTVAQIFATLGSSDYVALSAVGGSSPSATLTSASGLTGGFTISAGAGTLNIAAPTISGTLTGADSGTWGSGGVAGTTINSTVIGGSTPAAATFTTATATGAVTARSGTTVPAGSSPSSALLFSTTSGLGIYFGSGAPTGSAAEGSLYVNSGGGLYYNNNGSTGWTAFGAAGAGCSVSGSQYQILLVNSAGTGCTSGANATITTGALTLGASGTAGSVAMGNATSGTVTLQPVTGALGSVTASLPANSGTIAETNLVETFSAAQTFSAAITYGGVTLSNSVTGTGSMVLSASPTLSGTVAGNITISGNNTYSGTAEFTGAVFSVNGNGQASIGVTSAAGAILIGQGSSYDLSLYNKNASAVCTVATGTTTLACAALTVSGGTTLSGALTYGGVTLSNAVTGTGNMVLSSSPTIATPSITTGFTIGGSATSGNIIQGNGTDFVSTAFATVAQIQAGTAGGILDAGNVFNGAGALTALSGTTSVTPDFSTGFNFSFTATSADNFTLNNPTNTKVGQTGCIYVTQPSSGTVVTITWGSAWQTAGGSSTAALTPTLSAVDRVCYIVKTSSFIDFSIANNVKH